MIVPGNRCSRVANGVTCCRSRDFTVREASEARFGEIVFDWRTYSGMRRFLRILAVCSSLTLMALFVHYRSQRSAVQETQELLPSSKVGRAMDLHSEDWSGKYPTAQSFPWKPVPVEGTVPPKAVIYSSKSGRIVPLTTPEPTSTPETVLMPSSKSMTVTRKSRRP